ncbi:hypothetical protein NLI96_g8080 [Meripilus lineatus]|uniref:Acylphosphatase n=1 Tax=Meripilus lineatus TaxID=2056292 RepID=A0AAD5UY70_9APHY|nr:hypothetical protein NLI96_g8080 [Physisporinus lineatus]
MSISSFEYVVRGTVQGVGFRVFTRRIAEREGIVGWVKNDRLGDVVGVAQGTEAALSRFKTALAKGPRHAEVEGVDVSEERPLLTPEFEDFRIRH